VLASGIEAPRSITGVVRPSSHTSGPPGRPRSAVSGSAPVEEPARGTPSGGSGPGTGGPSGASPG
jgi:hypothetical protein